MSVMDYLEEYDSGYYEIYSGECNYDCENCEFDDECDERE